MKTPLLVLLLVWVICSAGCITHPDLTEFRQSRPRSILVLPPLNDSTELAASPCVLAALTRPLGEAGYYVMPVRLVDSYFRENGLTVAGEIHQVPLQKLHEVFGADAVLYVHIKRFGLKYKVLMSDSTVELDARLVDARTGIQIWKGHVVTSSGQTGVVEPLVFFLLSKAVIDEIHREASAWASQLLVNSEEPRYYLPRGPWHPEFGRDLDGRPR